jgi:hypothetical protein
MDSTVQEYRAEKMSRANEFRVFTRPSSLVPRPLPLWLALGLITAAFACASVSPADAQTIYRYTDRNGAVVLTDKPPAGVKAEPFVTGEPATKRSAEKSESYMEAPPAGSTTAEDAIRQRDQKLDEAVKTVENRDRERDIERQKRLREADRLEAEAREPVPSTRENRQRQYELLQEAEKLRRVE